MAALAAFSAGARFDDRIRALPRLGVGISTEFGAGRTGLDILAFRSARPDLVSFLEVGVDLDRGLDADARAWIRAGLPTTYHFLDLNLEEIEDLDRDTLDEVAALAREAGAAWLCGDAGLWHVGPRDRGHGVLVPPILVPSGADAMAEATIRLRECTGFEVLPENPPAHVFPGPLHLLDYFGRVCDRADCGLVLDLSHLAVFQRVRGHEPLTALDGFPMDRILEIHVAGGRTVEVDGRTFVDDDHGTDVLPEVWDIFDFVLSRARNLRAIVCECERNPVGQVVPLFERLVAATRLAGRA